MTDASPGLLAPPRLRTLEDSGDDRRATWLELFFDLVFVVAVAQLSNALSSDRTLHGFLVFCGLFIPIWWAWVGFTFYADRFDTDDLVYRVLMLSGTFAVGVLASTVPQAARGDTTSFAVAYVAVRAVFLALNVRAWAHLPPARLLLNVYIPGFAAGALLILLSTVVAAPARYWIWVAAFTIDLGTPLVSWRRIPRVPVHASHIPERIGLFTLIVLGETVLAVVVGTERVSWSVESGVCAALGFTLGAAFWWLYFDFLDSSFIRRSIWKGQVYLYAHLPLMAGLIALGVGVKYAIRDSAGLDLADSSRWILCGALGLAFVSLAAMTLVSTRPRHEVDLGVRIAVAVAALALALLGGELGPVPVLALLTAAVVGSLAVELVAHREHVSAVAPVEAVEL
jgi:low temperature requirement protein LtrA